MEPTLFLLIPAAILIVLLLRHVAKLNVEIERNKLSAQVMYDGVAFRLKAAEAYIAEFETNIAAYNKAASGRRFRLSGGEQRSDDRMMAMHIASETSAEVSAEADFARAANQYVEGLTPRERAAVIAKRVIADSITEGHKLRRPYEMTAENKTELQEALKRDQALESYAAIRSGQSRKSQDR